MSSITNPLVQVLVMQVLEDADRSSLASSCREIAFNTQAEVFSELFAYVFGEPLVSSGSARSSTTRRSQNPREAYFKAMREIPKKWHFLLMSLHKKDYAKDKFRALMNRWRFPCPHSPSTFNQGSTSGVVLSVYQRGILNQAHAAFEHAPLLCVAARFSKWGAVRTLLEDYKADPTVTDARQMNILIMAAWSGKFNIVRFIFQHCKKEDLMTMMEAKGVPHMTSACGGTGPYNAYTWARRKAAYCLNDIHRKTGLQFKKIATYIQQRAEALYKDSAALQIEPTSKRGGGDDSENESRFIYNAMAVHDLRDSYAELLAILQREDREVPALVESAIADNAKLLKRAAKIEEARSLVNQLRGAVC